MGGVGFERGSGYEPYFTVDVAEQMYGRAATCCVRIPFGVASEVLDTCSGLTLRVRCDDGFVAYLNGVEVARRNFTGEPAWNSAAGAQTSDIAAVVLENVDIGTHFDALRPGLNLLAIHALNLDASSSDFLISVELSSSLAPAGGTPTGVSPAALKYARPISLAQSACVRARALVGTTWSALNEAVFAVGPVAQSVRISELMYHPQDTGDPNDPNTEYIELTNIGDATVNLHLVRLCDGIDFTFEGTELGPGLYVLVVKDRDAFNARYGPGLPVAGEYAGSLSNAGERIELQDALGTTIQAFTYDDGWHKSTDGGAYSLTVKDPRGADPNDWSDRDAWRPGSSPGGSPGSDDAATARQ